MFIFSPLEIYGTVNYLFYLHLIYSQTRLISFIFISNGLNFLGIESKARLAILMVYPQ